MRILVIHNRERKTGGESVAFDRECETLRRLGHELLTLQKSNRDFELAPPWRKLWLTALSIINVPAYRALRRAIRQFRPNVAIVHNAFPLWSITSYIALLWERIPIVHVVHNFRLRCLNGLYFRDGAPCTLCHDGRWWNGVRFKCVHDSWARSLIYGLITQTIWPLRIPHRVTAFRVFSKFTSERLIEMGISPERIHVIPNFSPRLAEGGRRTTEPTWVFLGHLGHAKGPQIAVDAMAQGAPGKLIVIGDGPLAADLKRRVVNEGLAVEFLGVQDGRERFNVLGQAWALIFPSLCFENGPLAILEAFALGVPVVASRIGSIPEYVTDGVSGRLFQPGDAIDLARVLSELGNDFAKVKELSVGAHNARAGRFAEANVGRQLVALLQEAGSPSSAQKDV